MSESKVKSENYVNIQGFMVKELKLKGNELIIYAIIYGFSQIEGQVFNGSLQYLADWTNSTKQGVSKNLKSLIEKSCIRKNEKFINGVKFCEYYVTEFNGVYNKVDGGMQQSLIPPMQQSLTNNIDLDKSINKINNKKKDNKKKEFVPPTLEEIQEYCKSRNNNIDARYFYDYFTASNWIDSKGNEVKSWKQKIITWEGYNKEVNNASTKGYNQSDLSKYDR